MKFYIRTSYERLSRMNTNNWPTMDNQARAFMNSNSSTSRAVSEACNASEAGNVSIDAQSQNLQVGGAP